MRWACTFNQISRMRTEAAANSPKCAIRVLRIIDLTQQQRPVMDIKAEEEKKEGSEKVVRGNDTGSEDGDGNETDSEDEELEDLPPEIAERLGDSLFDSEKELQDALVEAGIGDLPVVLVKGKPRLVMPSHQHNKFTTKYVTNFQYWTNGRWGKWGCCSGTHKIDLSNGKTRDPDLSYWGYSRCDPTCQEPLVEDSIPDVVIQFSWQNKMWYEEKALDDMMTLGLEKEGGALSTARPIMGYLIKVRFSKKRTLNGAIKGKKTQDMEGLDIYRLSHGTTLADARNPTNQNAELLKYTPNGQEVMIVIRPVDLDITGVSAMLCGEYTIRASEIFSQMERYQKSRQVRGLAT